VFSDLNFLKMNLLASVQMELTIIILMESVNLAPLNVPLVTSHLKTVSPVEVTVFFKMDLVSVTIHSMTTAFQKIVNLVAHFVLNVFPSQENVKPVNQQELFHNLTLILVSVLTENMKTNFKHALIVTINVKPVQTRLQIV
jgi:hypothetical protein